MNKLALLLAVAALAAVPAVSQAQHCDNINTGEVFVLSGVSTDPNPGFATGVNHGFYGCTADETDENLNTNYLVGTHVWLARYDTLELPDDAWFTFNGVTTPVTWKHNDTPERERWESQAIALPPGVSGEAVATVYFAATDDMDEYTLSSVYKVP